MPTNNMKIYILKKKKGFTQKEKYLIFVIFTVC